MTALVNRLHKQPLRFAAVFPDYRGFDEIYGNLEGSRLEPSAPFAQNVAYTLIRDRLGSAGMAEECFRYRLGMERDEWVVSASRYATRRLSDTCSPIFSPATLLSYAVPAALKPTLDHLKDSRRTARLPALALR